MRISDIVEELAVATNDSYRYFLPIPSKKEEQFFDSRYEMDEYNMVSIPNDHVKDLTELFI